MGVVRIAAILAVRGLRFRCHRALGRPSAVEALSLEVTRRCIARCVMCSIWRTPRDLPELDAAAWLGVLSSASLGRMVELDITGGEPFLRDDLGRLLAGLGELKARHLPRLQSVAVTTNGLLTRRVLEVVAGVGPGLAARGIGLVIALGMDGVGELHDRIRNVRGAWRRLDETVRGLEGLRRRVPGLVLGLKTTVTRYNAGELDRIADYADEHGLFLIVSPYIVTPVRYANVDLEQDLELSPRDREALRRFYEGPRFRWSHYRRELLRFLETGRMEKACSAGFNYVFIRSTGDVYPCPLIEPGLGNVRESTLDGLLRSPAAAAQRRRVGRLPECRTCTEPGLERYALPFEGWHYLRELFRLGPRGFAALHAHLGLDKYL